jgi:hypothetical protein
MSVSSINGHIKPPKGAVYISSGARQGWFVITYSVPYRFVNEKPEKFRPVDIFYNQDGREVFRVECAPVRRESWLKRLFKGVGEAYANPDFTQNV